MYTKKNGSLKLYKFVSIPNFKDVYQYYEEKNSGGKDLAKEIDKIKSEIHAIQHNNNENSLSKIVQLQNSSVGLSRINDIISGKLYFNTLDNFNDTYESLLFYDAEHYANKVQEKNKVKHSKFLLDKIKIKKEGKKRNNRIILDTDFLSGVGVSCFTNDWNNELMWAHYTGSGNGVCMEYVVSNKFIDVFMQKKLFSLISIKDKDGNFVGRFVSGRVCYEDSPVCLTENTEKIYFNAANKNEGAVGAEWLSTDRLFAIDSLMTKSKVWEYEQEYRMILPNHSGPHELDLFRGEDNNMILQPNKLLIGNRLARQYTLLSIIEHTANKMNISIAELDPSGDGYKYQCIPLQYR